MCIRDSLKIMRDNNFPMSHLCEKALESQSMTSYDGFFAHEGRVLFVLLSKDKYRPSEGMCDIFYKDISFTPPLDYINIPDLCDLFEEVDS